MKLAKATSWGGKSFTGQKRTVRFTFGLWSSRTESYRWMLVFSVEIGYWKRAFAINFGQRRFPKPRFKPSDYAYCISDTECIQIKHGRRYLVTKSFFKPASEPDKMEEYLELEDIGATYEAYRFCREGEGFPDYDPYYQDREIDCD